MSSLTSFNLRYGKLQIEEITTQVKEILAMIDDSIQEAHDRCETRVTVSLPFNFDIPNLSKLLARKKIYALIIEDLTCAKRGFITHLRYLPGNTADLDISWLTEEDELLRLHEIEILEYHAKPFRERDKTKKPQSLPFDERIKHYQVNKKK